jgi:hypothetical protein
MEYIPSSLSTCQRPRVCKYTTHAQLPSLKDLLLAFASLFIIVADSRQVFSSDRNPCLSYKHYMPEQVVGYRTGDASGIPLAPALRNLISSLFIDKTDVWQLTRQPTHGFTKVLIL